MGLGNISRILKNVEDFNFNISRILENVADLVNQIIKYDAVKNEE